MTDNEIIKALECCNINGSCSKCPYDRASFEHEPDCASVMTADALDLINRQKAEIERLKKDNEYILMQHAFQRRPSGDCWNDVIEKAKAEAVKEFAERLKEEAENAWIDQEGDFIFSDSEKSTYEIYDTVAEWCKDLTDNLVKEFTEDKNDG